MKIRIINFLLIALIIFNCSFSYAQDLNSLNSAIKANSNVVGKISGQGKNTLIGMSKDLFDVARYTVIAFMIIKILLMLADFSNAGDKPEIKAKIKIKATWLALGVVFSVNFWSLFNFARGILSRINLL